MIALVLAGGGVIAYLELAPHKPAAQAPLTPEARAYIKNLKLSDVGMKAAKNYFSQMVVEIAGNITNAGDRNLDTVEIYCVFHDGYDQMILRQRVAIVSPKMAPGGLKPGRNQELPPALRQPAGELESEDAAIGDRQREI